MCSKTRTSASTSGFLKAVDKLACAIVDADAVVIGAGSGLSSAAGFGYEGERFERYFWDFEAKCGFHDMYSGGFYPFKSAGEWWAYWSRYIFINRYMAPPNDTYDALRRVVAGKDYFVITTNVDHCFQRAGFDKKRLFYTQGDYGLFQCSKPCRPYTVDNEDVIRKMIASQGFEVVDAVMRVKYDSIKMSVSSHLIPKCPFCDRVMSMNLRADDTFAEDDGWRAASERCSAFLNTRAGKRVLFLELGVGYNTPSIIKYPFWRMTEANPAALYACVNMSDTAVPPAIKDRSLCIRGNIADVVRHLALKSMGLAPASG